MTAEFTSEEQVRLAPFFTNLDRPTFGLKLPQEVAGALFSRYSRSTKSLRRTFLDEFLGDPALGLSDLLGGQTDPVGDSAALKKYDLRHFLLKKARGIGFGPSHSPHDLPVSSLRLDLVFFSTF